MKILSALINNCNIAEYRGNLDINVYGIAYDSRCVMPGFVFFALDGIHTDGKKYIKDAVDRGAAAVFTDYIPENYNEKDYTLIIVKNTRDAMSAFSSLFYSRPSQSLKVIGVTGTDGKSTTVSFIYQLLKLSGKKAGFISTVDFDCTGKPEKNHYRQSTPESSEIMSILAKMKESSFEYAVVEATSHGLSDKTARLKDIVFKAAVLTNISHEHLEFHGTLENYINDKANLFRKASDYSIINLDEPNADFFRLASKAPVFTYSIENKNADIYALNVNYDQGSSSFDIQSGDEKIKCILPVPGKFNIENFLAALLSINKITGISVRKLADKAGAIMPVYGRMDYIQKGQPFSVIVDYAHTPGAFQKLFPVLRQTAKKNIISVFGSAGERDLEKRKIQGQIAGDYSDIIILTDEDPRGESSMKIIDDISEGIKSEFPPDNIYKIPDRMNAVRKAVELAQPDDIVVFLGKGHESSIIYNNISIEWNEKNAVIKALGDYGYDDLFPERNPGQSK